MNKNIKEIEKIKKLANKKGTRYLEFTQTGKAVCFFYQEGSRVRGYSYADMQKAIPAELRRLGNKD